MKLTVLLLLMIAQLSYGALFKKVYQYLHLPTGRVVAVKDLLADGQRATLWDPFQEIVQVSELSQEVVGQEVFGVKAQKMILVKTPGALGLRSCEALHVFENGYVHFVCFDGWKIHEWGRDPLLSKWNIHGSSVLAELDTFGDFKKFGCGILKQDVGDLQKGQKVRIDVIFPNGQVMVRKSGFGLLDGNIPLLNSQMRRTHFDFVDHCDSSY